MIAQGNGKMKIRALEVFIFIRFKGDFAGVIYMIQV
jgi:hypothetical protein